LLNIVEIIGWVASALLAIRILPQAFRAYKRGNAKGLSPAFLWMWLFGQSLILVYIVMKHGWLDLPFISYSIVNIFFIVELLRYRYFPRIVSLTDNQRNEKQEDKTKPDPHRSKE